MTLYFASKEKVSPVGPTTVISLRGTLSTRRTFECLQHLRKLRHQVQVTMLPPPARAPFLSRTMKRALFSSSTVQGGGKRRRDVTPASSRSETA